MLVQLGSSVLDKVVERAGVAAAAVGVVPKLQTGPIDGGTADQVVEVVNV